jgi:hypothetical protein
MRKVNKRLALFAILSLIAGFGLTARRSVASLKRRLDPKYCSYSPTT